MRNVRRIYQANSQHWVGDGFLVQPLFSHMSDDKQTDPFLMLDYGAPMEFAPNHTGVRVVWVSIRTKVLRPSPSLIMAKWRIGIQPAAVA